MRDPTTGKPYWFNRVTKETTWNDPTGAAAAATTPTPAGADEGAAAKAKEEAEAEAAAKAKAEQEAADAADRAARASLAVRASMAAAPGVEKPVSGGAAAAEGVGQLTLRQRVCG